MSIASPRDEQDRTNRPYISRTKAGEILLVIPVDIPFPNRRAARPLRNFDGQRTVLPPEATL